MKQLAFKSRAVHGKLQLGVKNKPALYIGLFPPPFNFVAFLLFPHELGCITYNVSASVSDATSNIHAIYNPNINPNIRFTGAITDAYE